MSIQAVEASVDALCTSLQESILLSSDSHFIEEHRHDIAAVVDVLDENDRKMRMIDNYMEDWRAELAKARLRTGTQGTIAQGT